MTVKRFITGLLALLVVALMMAPSLMAQSLVSGDLTGTVTDPSGAVVSGAAVTLKNDATGQTRNTTTNGSGAYRFSLLQPGNYTVTASATGFSKAQSTTSIAVGQATIADLKMAVGNNTQTVEVTTTAPLVQADNADLSTNFNQTQIANQPNGGNDITYIAQTAPGVSMNTGMGYGNFQTSGLPATSNLFTVNGENDMDPVSEPEQLRGHQPDAGQERCSGSYGRHQCLLRPVRTAGGCAGFLRHQVRHQPVPRQRRVLVDGPCDGCQRLLQQSERR